MQVSWIKHLSWLLAWHLAWQLACAVYRQSCQQHLPPTDMPAMLPTMSLFITTPSNGSLLSIETPPPRLTRTQVRCQQLIVLLVIATYLVATLVNCVRWCISQSLASAVKLTVKRSCPTPQDPSCTHVDSSEAGSFSPPPPSPSVDVEEQEAQIQSVPSGTAAVRTEAESARKSAPTVPIGTKNHPALMRARLARASRNAGAHAAQGKAAVQRRIEQLTEAVAACEAAEKV